MGLNLEYEATLALKIDRLMWRFHADFHPHATRIDLDKVGPIGGMIMFIIAENTPTTAQAIATHVGRDKSQISRVVSLLVRKGLIEKSSNGDDARVSELCLTERGQLQVAAFNGALVEATQQTLGHLSPSEVEQFSELLSKILAAPSATDLA